MPQNLALTTQCRFIRIHSVGKVELSVVLPFFTNAVNFNSCFTEHVIILLFLVVSEEELRRLGRRFKKLDIDKNGTISIEEFMSLPELQQNPLVRRVIDLFDTDRNGEIDFKGTFYISYPFKFITLIINK